MKKYVKFFICILFAGSMLSCSDDDSKSNGNSSGEDVTFNGSGLEFVDISVSEDNDDKLELIFTTKNNISIIVYVKKAEGEFQDTSDSAVTYTADGGNYQSPDYPDKTVRGYVNGEIAYTLESGTMKVKLNENGTHDFTFNLEAMNEDGDEAALKGTASIKDAW